VIGQIIFSLMPVVALFAIITMLVLRAGASRVFFDVVGSFQADRLIGDAEAKITVLQGLMLDGLSGITEGISEMSAMVDKMVDSTVPLAMEIGNARIEFEKFANFAGAEELQQQIIDIGESYAFTGDQALAAGAKMAQLSQIVGGGPATAAATEVGIQFGLIGGMETADAMKKLISLQQQTGFMYGDLTKKQFKRLSAEEKANVVRLNSIKMLNQLNTIENRSAATMSQITHVMNQFASSAKLAGDEVSYMAAMSATLIEAGEEQGKAGRALKMMYARLGANTGNNAEILRQYGIEVKGANGELRSMEDILGDVAQRYDQLEDAEILAISQAIAGNDHYVRAIKLFENHARVLKLDSDAVAERDTAQEELNKRMKDNVFLLEQQQARLINSKALIGDVFVPAILRATKAQADMNFMFAEMAEEGTIYGKAISGIAKINALGKMYAPIAEAMLNTMSLNVSLKTQQQIQRSLNNEQLVRASAYGAQVSLGRINLTQLDQELGKQSQSIAIQIASLGIETNKAAQEQKVAGLKSAMLRTDELRLQTAVADTQQKVIGLQIEKQLADNRKITSAIEDANEMKRLQQLQEKLRLKKAGLMTVSAEELAQQRLIAGQYKKLDTVQKVLNHRTASASIERTLATNEELHTIKQMNNAGVIVSITEKEQMIQQAIVALKNLSTFQNQKQITAEKNLLNIQQSQLQAQGQQALLSMQNTMDIQGDTVAHHALAAAKLRLVEITKMKSNTEQQNAAISKVMAITARELAAAYGMQEKELMQLLPKMKLFAHSFSAVQTQQELTVQKGMRLQNSLMATSGIVGMMSMSFTMLSDSERSARASMILMNLSMVPAVFQMIMMTKQSTTMMAGMAGVAGATDVATASVSRFSLAMKGIGVGLAIAAVAYGAYWFAGLSDAKKATDALDHYNETVDYTQELFAEMTDLYAGDSLQGITDAMIIKLEQVRDLNDKLGQTDDISLINSYEKRIALAEDELHVLQDLKNQRAAQSLVADSTTAAELFNQVKAMQELGDAASDAADNNTFLDGFHNFIGDKNIVSEMSLGLFDDPQTAQDIQNQTAQVYADAFAAIPEEFQGAIQDLAESSESFDEFMSELALFSDEMGYDFGRQFNEAVSENIIGPIEAAKEAAFEFGNAREEMFFGMAKGNLTGDMVKQVVNKGVETLINTVEIIQTNNFNGMTTTQAANEITKQVLVQLGQQGINTRQV
tara:strand:- start:2191 stop:5832 length:3642 start_codon:yes stop_codon:yes gene_type:complete